MRIDGPQVTSSLSLNGTTITDLNIFVTTGSLNGITGSYATTGSNLFKGDQTHSGSIIPAVNNTYDLGSPTNQFRHVYISSGSLYVNGTKVLGSTSQELQITTDTGQSFKILESGADTITLQSADGNVTLTSTGGGDIVMDPNTGVIGLKGTVTIYTGNKIVSSDGNAIQFGNGIAITGSIVATGTNLISGSSQVLNGSGIWSGSAQLPSGIVSGSSQLPSGIVSSSSQVVDYGFSTTGSNNFVGTQTITGSLFISQNLVVQGSSSLENITASAVNIGANIVNLNTANPAIRFAGLSVFDSGSIGGSGSLLYDSVEDEFIFIHRGDNINITSSVMMMGPQTYNNVGSEIYPTNNRILKSVGNEHIGDSIISETNGGIGISGSLSITGSIVATGTSLVSGSSQILNGSGIWSGSAQLPSGIVSGSAQTIANLPSGTVSGSAQVLFTGTTGYSTYINQAVLTTSNPTFNSVISGDLRYNGSGYITYDVANSGTNSLVVRKFGTTVLTLNSSGYLGVNVDPAFYLDVQSNVANTFYTIAQFENRDYTSGTRSFIRVRNWLSAGGSYSSYFGQGQDGKTYIIANNSARGGDIVIDGGTGAVSLSNNLTVTGLYYVPNTSYFVSGTQGFRFNNSTDAFNNLIIRDNGEIYARGGLSIGTANTVEPLTVSFAAHGLISQHRQSNGIGVGQNFYMKFNNAEGNAVNYAGIYADIQSNTTGAHSGRMILQVANAGSLLSAITVSNNGATTFSNTINASGSITTNATLFLTKNIVAGEATPLHFNYTTSDGVGPAIRMGTGTQGFWDVQPSSNNTRLSFEWTDTTNTLNLYSNGSVSVGSAIANVSNKLAVGGAVRANNTVYNWFQAGTNDWDNHQYLHLKTNLSSGANGNVDHTMSLFTGRLYSYSSAYIREGSFGFHNWSGTLYNPVLTGNFWAGGYSSSDGFVVLIVALGGGSYIGMNIDWHQSYPYGFRDRIVTSYAHSNSSSSLY